MPSSGLAPIMRAVDEMLRRQQRTHLARDVGEQPQPGSK
jgi:hypothetical protein